MGTHEMSNDATGGASAASVDMKLEVVVIPVSDVDRAKEFYSRLEILPRGVQVRRGNRSPGKDVSHSYRRGRQTRLGARTSARINYRTEPGFVR
jgi:hypothetical protein